MKLVLIDLAGGSRGEAAFYPSLDEAMLNSGAYELDGDDEVGVLVAYDVKTATHLYAVEAVSKQNTGFKLLLKSELDDIQNVLDLYQGYIITADDELKQEIGIW